MCHLQEFYLKYKDKGLAVLGFNCADDKKIALEMLRDNGVTFPNILDTSKRANKIYFDEYQSPGRSAVPMSYIIDKDGIVVDAWYDDQEGQPKAIEALQKTGGELGEAVARDVNARIKQSADDVATAAQRLFDAIRSVDYNRNWLGTVDWKWFPAKEVAYDVEENPSGWVRWVCVKFKNNPIVEVRLGKVFPNSGGLPTVHYELHLQDGEVLQDDLPFVRNSKKGQWVGWKGLDWHLQNAGKE
jgi:hypothetical protein